MDRRQFAIRTSAFLLSPAWRTGRSMAERADAKAVQPYSAEMPDMLESFLSAKLNGLAASWDRQRSTLKTAEQVEARNAFVREKTSAMFGPFPARCSLAAKVVSIQQREGYKVENVLFQSRPDFWVTGNLYVPTKRKGPFPGIISPCGHYPLARMLPQYQCAYISLVKSGFVVLAYDPIGQGERRQYWNPATNATEVGGPVYEHSMAGQLLLLYGENLTQYMVWDGMRAIDYLCSRPEVDQKRIGCAGHSGGGTLTKFVSVVDKRVSCAAILEGGTANQWPTHGIGLGDVEQNLFPAALFGIDNVDLHAAIAPRPLLAAIEHFTPAFESAAQWIRERYEQLGAGEKFVAVAADDPHSWTPKLRLATTDFFCRWLQGAQGPSGEAEHETLPPESLQCTANGSLRLSHEGVSIFEIIAGKQEALSRPPSSRDELRTMQTQSRDRLRELLHLKLPSGPIAPRTVATVLRDGYSIDKVEFLSEPGIYIPTWVFRPQSKTGPSSTIVYVTDEGVESEGMEFEGPEGSGLRHGVLDTLARAGYQVIGVDVRGIGQTRPSQRSSFSGEFSQLFDTETSMAYAAWSMDESLIGMRVQDVIRSIDYALSREDVDRNRLHVIGKGQGALCCLYAAAFDHRISTLICAEGLLSYRCLTHTDRYLYGADVFVPGILLNFDLPQIAALRTSLSLTLLNPLDAMKTRVTQSDAEKTYAWTWAAYQIDRGPERFRIVALPDDDDSAQRYLTLLQAAGTG